MKTHPNSSDEDYEEEEFIVLADFQSKIAPETLTDPNLNLKLIGIDTETPIMQINSKVFQGTFEFAMGTNVFFRESDIPASGDPNYELVPDRMFEYFNHTNKVLKMNRIFIDRKGSDIKPDATTLIASSAQQDEKSDSSDLSGDEDGTIKLTKSYAEALNQFLKPGELPPRTLDESDELFFRKYGYKKNAKSDDTAAPCSSTDGSGSIGDVQDKAAESRIDLLKKELELARIEFSASVEDKHKI